MLLVGLLGPSMETTMADHWEWMLVVYLVENLADMSGYLMVDL